MVLVEILIEVVVKKDETEGDSDEIAESREACVPAPVRLRDAARS